MLETDYRASRICRVLGNPTAYAIVKLLLQSRKTPSELAAEIGLSLPVISITLRTLRNIDLVRYETKGKEKIYFIKEWAVGDICRALERQVNRIRREAW